MSEIAIRLTNVTKKFCVKREKLVKYGIIDLLRLLLFSQGSDPILRKGEILALKNVSFEVIKGECIGIIGANGAGKTTLLRLINRTLCAESGEIVSKGNIVSIINRYAGFNEQLTGKENVYVVGALYKKRKQEIDSLFAEIVERSGLEEFIDAPLKTYSFGMIIRLAFAIALQMDADILLFDDVLMSGDYQFTLKLQNEIRQLKGKTTVLYASHDIDLLLAICDKLIVLDKGKMFYFGIRDKAKYYYDRLLMVKHRIKNENEKEPYADVQIFDLQLKRKGIVVQACNFDDDLTIQFSMFSRNAVAEYIIYLEIETVHGIAVGGTNARRKDLNGYFREGETKRIEVNINRIPFIAGVYWISISLYDIKSKKMLIDKPKIMQFFVENGPTVKGFVKMPWEWKAV